MVLEELERNISRLNTAIDGLFASTPRHEITPVALPILRPSEVTIHDYVLYSKKYGVYCRECGIILKNQITYYSHRKRCPARSDKD